MKCLIALVALTAAIAAPARAQKSVHPDFSGKWTLNVGRSEDSPLTPTSMSYSIEQHGDHLKVIRTAASQGGESAATLDWGIDGKAWKNVWKQNDENVTGLSTLSWEGSTLVIKTAVSFSGQDIQQVDRWSLSPDAKSLTVERGVDVQGQSLSAKLVLDRRQ